MADSTKELANELAAKRDALAAKFKEYTDADTGELKAIPTAVLEDIRKANEELTDLDKKWQAQRELTDIAKVNAERRASLNEPQSQVFPAKSADGDRSLPMESKSLGELFTESKEYKSGIETRSNRFAMDTDFDRKTAMTLTAGFAQEPRRQSRIIDYATRMPMIADLMPNTQTTLNSIRYMELTTWTNNAAEVAENAVKPEAALAFTERNVPVEMIAQWIPVTRQQLEDVPSIQSVINNQLLRMQDLKEESELLGGSGTPPAITGIYNKSGIATQAKGTDPTPSAFYKAFTKIRHTGFAEPTAIVIHPNDWEPIRLLQDAAGNYIWGSPAVVGPETMWGKPVVVTTAATEGTGITGDFAMFSELFRIGGPRLTFTDSHSDYFIYNKMVILCEERVAAVWYRASAFCTVTGI